MADLVYGESRISDIIKDVNGKSALNEENTFTQKNTFEVAPECSVDATKDNQLVNLKTLNAKIQESDIDTSGLAKLFSPNTFNSENTFSKKVFFENNEKSPNIGSASILSDNKSNGFISFLKNKDGLPINILAKMGILDGESNNTFDFKGVNDLTAFRFNKNVILENATEDNHALNRATADGRFIRRDIEDTLDNQLNFNVLPKSDVDATEDTHLVNLRTLNTKLVESDLSNVPKLDTDNIFTGNNTFNNPVIVGNATEDNHALNVGEADKRYVLSNLLEVDVTTEEELRNALKKAEYYRPVSDSKDNSLLFKINIKNDITLTNTIVLWGKDLRYVLIDGGNHTISTNNKSAFYCFRSSFLPRLDNLTIKNIGNDKETDGIDGICLYHSSQADLHDTNITIDGFTRGFVCTASSASTISSISFNIKNCKVGLLVADSGISDARSVTITNCNTGLSILGSSSCTIIAASFNNCKTAISAWASISLNANNVKITGSSSYALNIGICADVSIENSTFTNCSGKSILRTVAQSHCSLTGSTFNNTTTSQLIESAFYSCTSAQGLKSTGAYPSTICNHALNTFTLTGILIYSK